MSLLCFIRLGCIATVRFQIVPDQLRLIILQYKCSFINLTPPYCVPMRCVGLRQPILIHECFIVMVDKIVLSIRVEGNQCNNHRVHPRSESDVNLSACWTFFMNLILFIFSYFVKGRDIIYCRFIPLSFKNILRAHRTPTN